MEIFIEYDLKCYLKNASRGKNGIRKRFDVFIPVETGIGRHFTELFLSAESLNMSL